MFGNSENKSPSWEALELTAMANLFESSTPGIKEMMLKGLLESPFIFCLQSHKSSYILL